MSKGYFTIIHSWKTVSRWINNIHVETLLKMKTYIGSIHIFVQPVTRCCQTGQHQILIPILPKFFSRFHWYHKTKAYWLFSGCFVEKHNKNLGCQIVNDNVNASFLYCCSRTTSSNHRNAPLVLHLINNTHFPRSKLN